MTKNGLSPFFHCIALILPKSNFTINPLIFVNSIHDIMDREVKYMFLSPMLLQKTDKPFDHENFVSELKMDGFRLIQSFCA